MLRATFSGSAYVGVFANVLGDVVVVSTTIEEDDRAGIGAELEASVVSTTIGGGSTVGSLICGNRHGAIVSGQVTEYEREQLESALDRPVTPLPDRLNAAGNLLLTTDQGALVHPEIREEALEAVQSTLAVPVERGTLGGVKTVGMAGVATTKGALCHPRATDSELDLLEETLGVSADFGTINYGSPLVGSGLLATEYGFVAGDRTTGPELGRIEEALDLID